MEKKISYWEGNQMVKLKMVKHKHILKQQLPLVIADFRTTVWCRISALFSSPLKKSFAQERWI